MKVSEMIAAKGKTARIFASHVYYRYNYGASYYTFSKPNQDRQYIKILIQLVEGPKSKNTVHKNLDMGSGKGQNSGTWSALNKSGLASYSAKTRLWSITDLGCALLSEVGAI